MSKSRGNILDPIEIINKYGVDQLRYYLIKEVSLGNDGNVSLDSLKNCINNDLANNFGNLCQRVFSFVSKNCNSEIPPCNKFYKEDELILNNLIKKIPYLQNAMNNQDINIYIKEVINFSFDANKYFNDLQPWALKKNNLERMNSVIYTILNQIRSISILLSPIIPQSSNKILNILNINDKGRTIKKILDIKFLKSGSKIKKTDILFKKVEDDN